MKKFGAVLLLAVAAACSRSETVTTDTAQSSTGVTASSTATTASTDTITPGTSSVTPTATETVAPAPPVNVATAPGTPSATRAVPASRRPAKTTTTQATETVAPHAAPAPVTETVAPHPSTTSDAAPAPTSEIADGQAIFRSKCTGCHGADGRKPANGHVLASAQVRAKSDAELTRTLHEGAGKISAMAHKRASLTDAQVKAVVAYVKAMQ
ncbi:MAG TPA: c-type cytochrome [Thermoanaerobaculia bacterium]|nr:c-type cytochrome [Thermoanaerobaculia bacterium]